MPRVRPPLVARLLRPAPLLLRPPGLPRLREAGVFYRRVAWALRPRPPGRHHPSNRKDRLMAVNISVDLEGLTWGNSASS